MITCNPAKLDKTLNSPKNDRDILINSPHARKNVNVSGRGSKLNGPVIFVILFFVLSGCAAKNQIFLEPIRQSEQLFQASSATLYFQPLQNKFAAKQQNIGLHTIGGNTIKIVSDYDVITNSFNALLQKKMNEKGWQVTSSTGWNMTPGGLAGLSPNKGTVLSGVIEKLTMSAVTGKTRTNTTYTLDAVVVLAIGKISEKKMTRRTIEMQERTIKVTYSQKTMKQLFDRFVEDVTQRAIDEYAEFVR